MRRLIANPTPCGVARRDFLWQTGGAFASLALVDLLGQQGFFGGVAQAEERKNAEGAAAQIGRAHV